MFAKTAITNLARMNSKPLFEINTSLINIDGMFYDCPNLKTLPNYLFTKENNKISHPELTGAPALFGKNPSTETTQITIKELASSFWQGISTNFINIGKGSITNEEWGPDYGTLQSNGGIFQYADIDQKSIENIFNTLKDKIQSVQWAFKDATGFTKFSTLSNCSKLVNAYGLF